MKIISVYSPKGGSGKSTLCIQLSGCLASLGYKVAVVDLDEQLSAFDAISEACEIECYAGFPESQPNVQILVIDHPPGLTLPMQSSDLVLFPIEPDRLNVTSANSALEILKDKNFKTFNVLNKWKGTKASRVENQVKDLGLHNFLIRERASYKAATAEGRSVFSENFSGKSNPQTKQAKEELEALAQEILKVI